MQITYYSTMLFLRAGLTENTAQYATLGVSCVNVLMTLISLILVEKSGRKTLLLIGFGGMFVSTILLSRCLAYVVSELYFQWCIIKKLDKSINQKCPLSNEFLILLQIFCFPMIFIKLRLLTDK